MLIGGTAAVAAAVGIGAGWWRWQGEVMSPAAASAPPGFWSLRFARPGGGELAMADFRGRPLLLNFWATWCPPCVREMPEVDRFAQQFASNGWQVLGLAADQEKPVLEFLSRKPVSYPIALAGFEGIALSRSLGNEGGALPFTLVFDSAGSVVQRHLGETRFDMLAGWATKK